MNDEKQEQEETFFIANVEGHWEVLISLCDVTYTPLYTCDNEQIVLKEI